MSSLYKRANPRQRRILRIVEGAVKNVADHHPAIFMSASTARSIAKRAAGTLTAQWPEVLALPHQEVSDSQDVRNCRSHSGPEKAILRDGQSGGGASHRLRRSPFPRLYKELSWRTGAAFKAGKLERHATFIEVLRLIDQIEKETTPR